VTYGNGSATYNGSATGPKGKSVSGSGTATYGNGSVSTSGTATGPKGKTRSHTGGATSSGGRWHRVKPGS